MRVRMLVFIVLATALAEANSSTRSGMPFGFSDQSLETGLLGAHVQRARYLRGLPDALGAGVCIGDVNNDFWPDILVLSGSGSTRHYGRWDWWSQAVANAVYVNRRGESFDRIELQEPDTERINAQGCAIGDLDGDGHEDVVISAIESNQIWRNRGDGTFELVQAILDSARPFWTTGVTLVDVNRDGLLDLYMGGFIEYAQNAKLYEDSAGFRRARSSSFEPRKFDAVSSRLYLNRGGFEWQDITASAGVENRSGRTYQTLAIDLDGDHWPDLVEINVGSGGNRIYINEQGSGFRPGEEYQSLFDEGDIHALSVVDWNGNEIPDLVFVAGAGHSLGVRVDFHTDRTWMDPHFGKQTLGQSSLAIGSGDFDNDGKVDLYLGNGYLVPHMDAPGMPLGQGDRIYYRRGNGWIEQSDNTVGSMPKSTRAAVTLDYNNDGMLDLYVAHNNALGHLLARRGENDREWLQVVPIDQWGHRGRVVRVTLRASGHSQSFFGNGRRQRLGQNSNRFHFGLEDIEGPIEVEMLWPGGERTILKNPARNHVHVVSESGDQCSFKRPEQTPDQCARQFGFRNEWEISTSATDVTERLHTMRRAVLGGPSESLSDESAFSILEGRESDESIYWLIDNLDRGRHLCRTANTLAAYYQEEEAAVRARFMAVNHLARALSDASDKEIVCLLEALGKSERFRAFEPIVNELDDVNILVRRAAVRALGDLRQQGALPTVRRLVMEAPIGIAAEAAISLEQIAPGEGAGMVMQRLHSMESRVAKRFRQILIRKNRQRPVFSDLSEWLPEKEEGQ